MAILSVGAVAIHDGDLLLVQRGHEPQAGTWSIPGGRVEDGELVAESVVRELFEETGLIGVCGSLIGWTERVDDSQHLVILDFEVTVLERLDPVPGDDATDAAWVPLVDVVDYDLSDGLAEFLHEHGVIDTIA